MNATLPQAFAEAVRRDPAAPLLTWYDDATGDRTELSGLTLDNWVAKTANMFADGAGLVTGDTVGILMPPHWQTAAVLLGAAAAGLEAHLAGPPSGVDALVASVGRVAEAEAWAAGDRYVTGLLPFALPLREIPAGFVDFPTEVRTFGDHFRAVQPVRPGDVALDGETHAEVLDRAAARATELGITAGARVLVDTRTHPQVIDWLLAPLAAGATVVLCGELDPAKLPDRVAAERVTLTVA